MVLPRVMYPVDKDLLHLPRCSFSNSNQYGFFLCKIEAWWVDITSFYWPSYWFVM